MLTYDYACETCQHRCEIRQSIKDDPITKCPKCEHETLSRLICAVEFFDTSPKTLGSLAEKNQQKLGSEALSEKREIFQEQKAQQRELARDELERQTGKKINREKPKTPWFGKLDKDTKEKLVKNPGKVDKYIREGKV